MPVLHINGVALTYREVGDRNKRTLVLLHTVLWSADVFDHLIATLAKDFHIIDIDLHGHGQSGYRTPLRIEEMAADYHQFLTQLGLSKVTWIGYSLGSMIGMNMALRYPDLFHSLVLIATNARRDETQLGKQTQQLWDLFRAGHREDIVEPALQLFFARATYAQQPQLVEQYRRAAISFQDVEGIYQAAMAAAARSDVMDQLGAIRAKTLIIAGREDVTSTPAEAEEIAARIPDAQVAIVEDTSHLLMVEKPQEVVQIIREFLK